MILLKPEIPGSNKGAQYPIKNHGPGTVIGEGTISACLRRFEINPKDFWK